MDANQLEESTRSNVQELLIATGEASIDRLPVLRSIFEQMAADFAKRIQQLFGTPAVFLVDEIIAARIGETHFDCDECKLAAIYHAGELDSRMIVGVERGFIISMIDVMFGSNVANESNDEDRIISHIESRVVQSAIEHLTKAFEDSLASIVATTFQLEGVESKLDLTAIGRKNSVAIICKCKLRAFGRDGMVLIAIPRSALDPFRAALSRNPSAEGSSQDQRWAKSMYDRAVQTEVTLHATMEKEGLTLDDVARLEVGQIVHLPISPTSLIKLECEKHTLFWCALGQKDGFYTVRIEDFVDDNEEFIQNILGV